jgi:hypothetical protein
MARELAAAGGRTAQIWVQADSGAVNIVAGGGRAAKTINHGVALGAGSASAVSDPERSVL